MTEQTIQRSLLIFLLLTAIPFLSIPKSFAVAAYNATQTIYITNTGSVVPDTGLITQNGNTYTLNNNITSNLLNTIIIQRNNMILDGAGFTVQGNMLTGSHGIVLDRTKNVTVKNIVVKSFKNGIYGNVTSNSYITEANLTNNDYGIYLQTSKNNTIDRNNITQSTWAGIWLQNSQNNYIDGNRITNSTSSTLSGIRLEDFSDNNKIISNYLTNCTNYGIYIDNCASNRIFHNSFISAGLWQAFIGSYVSGLYWDDGYPSGGNYWSDYGWLDIKNGPNQNQLGSDGIGDTPYTIDASNRDRYPLKNPWTPTYTNITVNTTQKPVIILSNTTITDITSTANTLNFNAAGTQTGYALITFPNVNNTAIQIRINGNPPISPFPIINTNGTHWFIYFEFHLSTQPITIIYDIPQLPVPIAPGGIITLMLAMIMALVGSSMFRRHRKRAL
jgi:parallel beta-helix repeat protein